MFCMFEAFAGRVSEQAKEYAALQDNVRQRTMSALFDPFQILQPARATVQTSNAKDMNPPAGRPGKARSASAAGRAKRPAPDFA